MFYFDPTMYLLIPGLLLGIFAQISVKRNFAKYKKVKSKQGITAEEVCRQMLTLNNNNGVTIKRISGNLTDNYNPQNNTLSLSDSVYGSTSIASIGVAAHECGHAMQKADNYPFLNLRTAIVPIVKIGSSLYFPIFILGLLFSWEPLINIGIICFGLTFLFSLITLPVEFNASKRALQMLEKNQFLDAEEIAGVRAVLNAAAMTYVASMISSLLQLIRLWLISRNRD